VLVRKTLTYLRLLSVCRCSKTCLVTCCIARASVCVRFYCILRLAVSFVWGQVFQLTSRTSNQITLHIPMISRFWSRVWFTMFFFHFHRHQWQKTLSWVFLHA